LVRLRTFQRAVRYLPRYKKQLILGYACVLPGAALSMTIPRVIGHAIDGAISMQVAVSGLALLGALILGLVLLRGLVQFGSRWLLVGASRKLERDLREDLYAKLQTLPPQYFGQAASGDLVARMTSDVEAVRLSLGPGMMYLASTVAIVPAVVTWMMLENWTLALFIFVPMILLAVVLGLLSPELERSSRQTQEATGDLAAAAAESFSGISVLKIFTREAAQLRRMDALGLQFLTAQMRLARARGKAISLLHSLIGVSQLAILWVGSLQILAGTFTVGDFFTFLEWLALCLWPLIAVGWMVGTLHRGAAAMERINEIFDADARITSPAQPRKVAPPATLEWDQVSVSFQGVPALQDVSLQVPAGTSLGITGRTGSGKSTLVELLARMLDPTSGAVRIGGVDVREWALKDLRTVVGLVPQDSFLFSDSVRNNLRFAAPECGDEAIYAAARQAALGADLDQFPEKLDTAIGERGLTLSGGQRQRATIVRTLLARPPVLVLDDCLSAVDAGTEAQILQGMDQIVRQRTTLMISHRVAALETMDRVAVLEQGRLVECGTPAELLQKNGVFADLKRRQQLEQELREI
jgi:ATP-binding cassette subfamily B protein